MVQVGTTAQQTYLPGLTSTLTSILQANLVVSGGSYIPVEERIYSTGTWQRPTGISDWIEVTCVGGGGSGGKGASWTYSGAGGGGAGQYLKRIVNISSINALSNITVVIGQGGASVTSGNTNGNDGGDTSFGVNGNPFYMIAYGGGGGAQPNTNGRSGRSGYNGVGAEVTGGGSGGGGGGYWQHQWNGGGGGGGSNGAGMNAFCLDRTNGTFYTGYMPGKGYGEGSSDGGWGVSSSWGTYHTHGGRGGPGIDGLAGGGGGGGGTAGGGSCGGGMGGDNLTTNSGNQGVDGTGSGGGGTYWTGGNSGKGGNGVIILRYLKRIIA